MPKVETSKSPNTCAKHDPYAPRKPAAKAEAVTKSSQELDSLPMEQHSPTEQLPPAVQKKPLSFLDLPAEIRLKVYKNLCHIPPKTDNKNEKLERSNVIQARYSLQLTCRQINREWSPLFYATTTIVAHGLSIAPRNKLTQHREYLGRSNRDFEGGFLEPSFPGVSLTSKLRNLRRLAYDMRWIAGDPELDCKVYSMFSFLERYEDTLESLDEVMVNGNGRFMFYRYTHGTKLLERIWSEATDLLHGESWFMMERQFFQGHRHRSGWSSVRRMHILDCSEFGFRVRGTADYKMVDKAQLVFRKGVKPLAQATDEWVELPGKVSSA